MIQFWYGVELLGVTGSGGASMAEMRETSPLFVPQHRRSLTIYTQP